jgi:O-acetyl-ADP-ribose deacetylase (regulator of RNase III)
MLIFEKGNLFDSKCQVLVNTVNCIGVMGKGIALEFKRRYPKMFLHYKRLCDLSLIHPGVLYIYRDETPWVINFPTKEDWRNNSKLEYIEKGLITLVHMIDEYKITSIAIPALGCSNGKLNWKDVKQLIETYLSHESLQNVCIEVYEPWK